MYRADALRGRLPGLLDPSPRVEPPSGTVLASVLVPVVTSGDDPHLVFTRRSDTLSRHAGEISFPGGLVDPGEDLAAAALREAHEELALAAEDVELAGALPAVHTSVSGVHIVPFVGFLRGRPAFVPSAAEIAEVLEFRLEDLVAVETERDLYVRGRTVRTFVYELGENVIWGATGRIVRSLVAVLVDAAPGREVAG